MAAHKGALIRLSKILLSKLVKRAINPSINALNKQFIKPIPSSTITYKSGIKVGNKRGVILSICSFNAVNTDPRAAIKRFFKKPEISSIALETFV